MALCRYFTISLFLIIAATYVLSAPIKSQELTDTDGNSEDSGEDKPIPAKSAVDRHISQEDDNNDGKNDSNGDMDKPEKEKYDEKKKYIVTKEEEDKKEAEGDSENDSNDDEDKPEEKKVEDKPKHHIDNDDEDSDDESVEPAPKQSENADLKPADTSASENGNPAAAAAKPDTPDLDDSSSDDDNNEEVPQPMKDNGLQAEENPDANGVANLTENKQMDERQDGEETEQIPTTASSNPNSGFTNSLPVSFILALIVFYLF